MLEGCQHCRTTILFGGVRRDGCLYCSERCADAGWLAQAILREAKQIPAKQVETHAGALRTKPCPACGGAGPLEVYHSHRIWSLIKITSYQTREHYCCQPCGRRRQLGDVLFSLCCGWWSVFGLIGTPIYLWRGLRDWRLHDDAFRPSARLLEFARFDLARERVASAAVAAQTGAKPTGTVADVLEEMRVRQKPPVSGWAVASLVCGIAGLVICCMGVGLPLGLAAVACGWVALRRVQQGRAGGNTRGFAWAGIVCGIVALMFGVVMVAVMIGSMLKDRAWRERRATQRAQTEAVPQPEAQPPVPQP